MVAQNLNTQLRRILIPSVSILFLSLLNQYTHTLTDSVLAPFSVIMQRYIVKK